MTNRTRTGARLALASAEREYHETIRAALPIGSRAYYDGGKGTFTEVKVIDHSQDRVRVANSATGKSYWLYESRLETAGGVK